MLEGAGIFAENFKLRLRSVFVFINAVTCHQQIVNMKSLAIVAFLTALLVVTFAKPAEKQDEHQSDRVKDTKLSDEAHFEGKEHNVDYDHEAFLGEDEAKTFKDLSPEESRKRLG